MIQLSRSNLALAFGFLTLAGCGASVSTMPRRTLPFAWSVTLPAGAEMTMSDEGEVRVNNEVRGRLLRDGTFEDAAGERIARVFADGHIEFADPSAHGATRLYGSHLEVNQRTVLDLIEPDRLTVHLSDENVQANLVGGTDIGTGSVLFTLASLGWSLGAEERRVTPPRTAAPTATIVSTEAPVDVEAPPAAAVMTASGLGSIVLREGTGDTHPGPRSTVEVHYSGWTVDGELFDSSVSRGETTSFPLNAVIPGWTEGLQLMVEGEVRRFWIPEDLAYGGRPGAPAGMLVFEVELIRIVR